MKRVSKIKKQWAVTIAATVLLGWTLRRIDPAALRGMGAEDIIPVVAITLMSVLLKTGMLTGAVLLGSRLWNKLACGKN